VEAETAETVQHLLFLGRLKLTQAAVAEEIDLATLTELVVLVEEVKADNLPTVNLVNILAAEAAEVDSLAVVLAELVLPEL
jgi:hypothetical protein